MAELIKRPDFFIIPSILVGDKAILPKDYLVYAAVYWFTKLRNDKCIASNKTLASVIGCSLSTVTHGLVRLNKAGYIQIRIDEKNHREEIIPLIAFSHIDTPGNSEQSPGNSEQGGLAISSNPPGNSEQHNKNIEEEKENNISPLPPKASNGSSHKGQQRPEENPTPKTIANSAKSAVINYGVEWKEFFEHYKLESGSNSSLRPTDGRFDKFKTRRQSFSLEEMKQAVTNCFQDNFFSGNNDRGWRADIDYILRNDEKLEKLLYLKPRQGSSIIKEG